MGIAKLALPAMGRKDARSEPMQMRLRNRSVKRNRYEKEDASEFRYILFLLLDDGVKMIL